MSRTHIARLREESTQQSRRRNLLGVGGLLVLSASLALAVYFIVTYLYVALSTIGYPYQLEWMEGAHVEAVYRVYSGQPLYPPPSIDYVPQLYTPLCIWTTAALARVFGVGFFVARLVSFSCICGCALIVFALVRRETKEWVLGLIATGLFLATADAGGQFFHFARVDSFSLLLVLASVYVFRAGSSWRTSIASGVLLWLGFLSKQNIILIAGPMLVVMCLFERRRALIAGATALALASVSLLIGNAVTDGWLLYYVLEVGRKHRTEETVWVTFWTQDIFQIGIAFVSGVVGTALLARNSRSSAAFYGALIAGAIIFSWTLRLHSGGYINVLTPIHCLAAMTAGFAMWQLGAPTRMWSLKFAPWRTLACAALVLQFLLLRYDPATAIPTDSSAGANERFLAELASIGGDVLVLDQGWLPRRAGKRLSGQGMAARDLWRITDEHDLGRVLLRESYNAALARQQFTAVIIGHPRDGKFFLGRFVDLERWYRLDRTLEYDLRPVRGGPMQPRFVWVPKESNDE